MNDKIKSSKDLPKPKKTREYDLLEPVYLRKLAELEGRIKAAKAVGCHPTTVSKALISNQISRAYEMAAELVWRKVAGGTSRVIVLKGDPEDLRVIEQLAKAFKVEITKI